MKPRPKRMDRGGGNQDRRGTEARGAVGGGKSRICACVHMCVRVCVRVCVCVYACVHVHTAKMVDRKE